jgi:hypothetical protein
MEVAPALGGELVGDDLRPRDSYTAPIAETPFTEEEPPRRRSWWRENLGME